jgi:ABC-2 type transport system ATP-binding protein
MIEAVGLAKKFGDRKAVDGLSFQVQPGVVTGFLGPNGAGKSTTMRLMVELDRGDGLTKFAGQRYRDIERPMRRVGVLLEAKAFHPTRTARNHLRMLAAANAIAPKRADDVLALVGLDTVADKKPKSFSLGMGQRLGLAAALLGEPEVLMLDEPANGLDPQGITWLRDFLKAYAAAGNTVFASSHLLAEMQLMADHLIVIGRGRLLADTTIGEFVARSSHTTVVVRSPESARLTELLVGRGAEVAVEADGMLTVTGMTQDQVGDLAFAERVLIHELTTRVATLEEAFLEVTAGEEEFGQSGGTS